MEWLPQAYRVLSATEVARLPPAKRQRSGPGLAEGAGESEAVQRERTLRNLLVETHAMSVALLRSLGAQPTRAAAGAMNEEEEEEEEEGGAAEVVAELANKRRALRRTAGNEALAHLDA